MDAVFLCLCLLLGETARLVLGSETSFLFEMVLLRVHCGTVGRKRPAARSGCSRSIVWL